jgi:hypothetical protein
MYIYMYTYIYICIHMYIHVYMYVFIVVDGPYELTKYLYIYIYINVYIYIYINVYICRYLHFFINKYLYIYIYIHMYKCIYTHIHTYLRLCLVLVLETSDVIVYYLIENDQKIKNEKMKKMHEKKIENRNLEIDQNRGSYFVKLEHSVVSRKRKIRSRKRAYSLDNEGIVIKLHI